ncbi:unnamed protein product [Haemonchus placei]|uniref:Ion channel n=1 Tax=Haemonchus placei TaxID=6290 RepID=A0A0N4WBJ1_HAEPC|nr:unnamed protein product [Haemonchus placei]
MDKPSTHCEDNDTKTGTPAEASENTKGILRHGRFQTIKVEEDEIAEPQRKKGLVLPLAYTNHNNNDVMTHITFPSCGVLPEEINPETTAQKASTVYNPLERFKNHDRARQGNHGTFNEKPKVTDSDQILNQLREKIVSTMRNPKKYGFKNICLLLLVLSYTLLGAAVFYVIESNYERKTILIRKAALDKTIESIAKEMTETINDPEKTVDEQTMITYLQRTYITLLKQESAYDGSTFYKAEDMERNLRWTFGSSCFFSMNVYTTTGYGSIAPESSLGKACVIIYGFLFVPLTLVVIRHLGNSALVILTNFYANIVIRWRRFRSKKDAENGEIFTLPVLLCMLFMLVYLMGTTTLIFLYDKFSGEPDTGVSYFLSFYFSFISISTIGLGDVMPNNVTFDPIITALFFFGMPLMKVVNSSTYQSVEKATIGLLTLLENRLSSICERSRVADMAEHSSKSRAITLAEATAPTVLDDPRNQFTIQSVLTFIKSDAHVYGHRFGRVDLTVRKDTI